MELTCRIKRFLIVGFSAAGVNFLFMILFAVMGKWGVYYLVNVAMGIGVVAVLNYALYDKLVFRREAVYDGKSL